MVRIVRPTAAVLLIVSVMLPWATYENAASRHTTQYRAGALGVVLVVLGLAALLTSMPVASRVRARDRWALWFGAGALGFAIVDAPLRMHAANTAAAHAPAGSGTTTSYAIGPAIAIAAALVVLVVSSRAAVGPPAAPVATPAGRP